MQTLKFIGLGAVALVSAFLIFGWSQSGTPEALGREACKDRIRLMSKNPSSVDFGLPVYRPGASRDEFEWSRDTLQMQNGFGAMLGTSAVCTVDKTTHAIVDMQLR